MSLGCPQDPGSAESSAREKVGHPVTPASREIGTDQAKKAERGGVDEGFEGAVVAVRACVRRHGAGLGEEVRKALGEVLDRAVARQNA